MRVALYADNTLPLAVPALCQRLNGLCSTVRFTAGRTPFRLTTPRISVPDTHRSLPPALQDEASNFDLACLATAVPYDNNFFFEEDAGKVLISFSNWNLLTDLPISNGLVHFVAGILLDEFGIGRSHHQRTGCANDFWWNKQDVDVGMRAGFVCGDCLAMLPDDARSRAVLDDVRALLDAVSRASRAHLDVLSVEPQPAAQGFDVFLCHNSIDKPAVRTVNQRLGGAGIRTWLDEEQLVPGRPWQSELERQIASVRNAMVLVGGSGTGPWQDAEIRAFLSEFASRDCPVIPVLLPDAPRVPELPLFLRQMTWVDLREDYDVQFERLVDVLRPRG